MKNAIVIALALVSVSAFSAGTKASKETVKACKAEVKGMKGAEKKEAYKACLAKAAPAPEAKVETAPAAAPTTK